tara:strand:+ start:182 stop:757 length:576 start_codon:yes stop_codon:yes gene_type:complete
MSITNKSKPVSPRDAGWIIKKLTQAELDFVWYCIDKKREDTNKIQYSLAGNISSSIELKDHQNLFWNSVANPLVKDYQHYYKDENKGKLHLRNWWVNYQKENEFNPLHKHSGVYSFVIWLKIPASSSNFVFTYTDLLGKIISMTYKMTPDMEGKMVLFPSKLNHEVYPFYDSDETRVSVSGNIVPSVVSLR